MGKSILHEKALQPIPKDMLNLKVVDLVTNARGQNFYLIKQWLPWEIFQCIITTPHPDPMLEEDITIWKNNPIGEFNVKNVYFSIQHPNAEENGTWRKIWLWKHLEQI